MKEVWHKVSYLGLDSGIINLKNRTVVLTNRINFILIITLTFLFLASTGIARIQGLPVTFDTHVLLIQAFLCIFNLWLARHGFHRMVKILVTLLPAFVLILLPSVYGTVDNDNFLYYPFALISLSILSQLIFDLRVEKKHFFAINIFYFVILLFIEKILMHYGPEEMIIKTIIIKHYPFYKVFQFTIYLFLSLSVFYLRNINYQMEKELNLNNEKLDLQNEELQSAMENLKNAQQQLVHSEKMASLGTFTSGMAHELNNPLNYITGGVEILKKSYNDLVSGIQIPENLNSSKKNIELSHMMITEGAERAAQIVRALTTFSTRAESIRRSTNMSELIDNTILILKAKIPRNVFVSRNYQFTEDIHVFPEKLSQVFLNILDNAVFELSKTDKQNPGFINISTQELQTAKGMFCSIDFVNSGAHIPDSHFQKLFDPFFTTKDPGEGTGLGLSIAYSIVKEHQGEIRVENLEHGVRFTVEIPVN